MLKKNKQTYYHSAFSHMEADRNNFLYELALQRGKNRGWYPVSWTLQDYIKYLFNRNLGSIY